VGKRSFGRFGAIVLALALLAVPLAHAEEVTRDSYKEAVEPICKVNVKATERILDGVKAKVRAGKLGAAATQFSKAADAAHKAYLKLKAVPQPPADEARLTQWLGYIQKQEGYFRKISKKLKAGDENGATAMVFKLEHNANQANNKVLPFEFKYCRVDPSKFS